MKKETGLLLRSGLNQLNIQLQENQIEKLLQYLSLLEKWNKTYNLTAVRNEEEMVKKHLLDSLACLPFLKKEKIKYLADVGTGAGLPGIPLAITNPEWQLLLIDSNSKKTGFLQQVKTELGLSNLEVITGRVEQVEKKVDAVISRAFTSLKDMLEAVAGLCGSQTVIWAMKGKLSARELNEIKPLSVSKERLLETTKNYRVSASHQLTIPGLSGDRCLLKLEVC